MAPNNELLEKIIGYDYNYWDIYNLRMIARRIERINKNDIHSNTLGRECGARVLINLSDILEKEYKLKK